ncbi:MAG: 30S ribosomal protein S4 [Brevinematales bacterium]|nr:30S ribosomal protein S4 [Brevinematales bacterium]
MYKGPVCRLCRREGVKLFLKGEKCHTPKCPLVSRKKKPGEPPKKLKPTLSEFGLRFREKQKLRRLYNMSERQLRRFLDIAQRRGGVISDNLLSLLESRLDNVVYRVGFARSRREARQLVSHKHFKVNGHYVNIPSYVVKPGDKIEFVLDDEELIKNAKEKSQNIPKWLSLDLDKRQVEVLKSPEGQDLTLDTNINLSYIIEYYSKF